MVKGLVYRVQTKRHNLNFFERFNLHCIFTHAEDEIIGHHLLKNVIEQLLRKVAKYSKVGYLSLNKVSMTYII